MKANGALLTWMLPDTFVAVNAVVSNEEPTATLREFTSKLRGSSELQVVWIDIQGHGQTCKL